MSTLLLIPGLAADAAMWRDQLSGLADLRPVVAQAHAHRSTIPEMATALLEEHPGPLVLCGASMGGMVAMEAARQAPDRTRGLALLGTTAAPESDAMRRLREDAIALFAQGRVREVIEPNIAFAFHPSRAGDRALTDAYLEFVLRAGPQLLIRQNRAVMARPDAREHLPRLACPVLVAVGDDDRLTPPDCSREIAALLPRARLEIVPACGHMLTMERPEAVNALLREWIATL